MNTEYMIVTADKFEMPVYTAKSIGGIMQILKKNYKQEFNNVSVRSAFHKESIVIIEGKEFKFIKVELEDDDE